MLNDRIVHESIPLAEEKRLVKEIKELEKTRSKVASNAANRTKMQETVVEKEAIHGQVKVSTSTLYCSFMSCYMYCQRK
jgi:uncharacterized coiled-coil DUF342 family protein